MEAEFGEPFEAVIRGFAAMGYGISETARAIGYYRDGETLRRLIRNYGWVIPWPSKSDQMKRIMAGRRPLCSLSGKPPHNARFFTHPLTGETLCTAQWAARIGITPKAMAWRIRRWPLIRALSYPAHQRNGGRRPRKPSERHPWKHIPEKEMIDQINQGL